MSKRFSDVLGAEFGVTRSSGAILVGSDQPLLVTSRTYNSAASGTFGQYVEGTPASRAVVQDEVVRLVQLTQNGTYRTNLGFASASASAAQGVVELYLANGTKLGERPFTLEPWGAFQEDSIFTKVTGQAVDDGYALVRATTADARIFPYASVVDGRTGDPVCVVPMGRPDPAYPGMAGRWSPTGVAGGASPPQPGKAVPAVAVAGNTVIAGAGSLSTSIYTSPDRGRTWTYRSGCGFSVAGFAVDPLTPSTVYAACVNSWGVYKSVDSGRTWLPVGQPLGTMQFKYAVAVSPSNPNQVYAGGTEGLVRSDDAGATWKAIRLWQMIAQPEVRSIAVDPKSADHVYVGTEEGVYVSHNGGSTFALSNAGTGKVYVRALLVDPANTSRVWAGSDGGLFLSTNRGATWERVDGSIGSTRINALVLDSSLTPALWAATRDGPFCSVDGGGHWAVCGPGGAGFDVTSLAVFKTRVSTLFAGTTAAGSYALAHSELYLPAAAHNPGANTTLWRTDLEVANTGEHVASFEIALLRAKADNSRPLTRTFTLGPGVAERFQDILETEFGYTGSAALRVTPTSGSLVATSRTYNQQPRGTFGQFIPGIEDAQAQGAENAVRLVQLAQSAGTANGFRTNIGLTNVTPIPIIIEIRLCDRDGAVLGSFAQPLLPYEFRQLDRPFAAYSEVPTRLRGEAASKV